MFNELDFFVFVAALSLAAFSPGPGLAAIVATVLAGSVRKAIWFCVGIIAGDLTWLALSLSGLTLIAQQLPALFIAIKWAGVGYLVYLAIKMWRTKPNANRAAAQSKEKSVLTRVLAGYSVTLGNPKAMLFYVALLPSLLDPAQISGPTAAALFLAVIGVLASVFAVYIFAADKARKSMANSQSLQKFNRITATALASAAIWIAVR
jgi:threonine/homoserine/homoserine lactone efflux protein